MSIAFSKRAAEEPQMSLKTYLSRKKAIAAATKYQFGLPPLHAHKGLSRVCSNLLLMSLSISPSLKPKDTHHVSWGQPLATAAPCTNLIAMPSNHRTDWLWAVTAMHSSGDI